MAIARILVRHGVRSLICKELNVSLLTVRRALDGETQTSLAQEVRDKALTYKGTIRERGKRMYHKKKDKTL